MDASTGIWYYVLSTQMIAFRLNLVYQFSNIFSLGGGIGLDVMWYGNFGIGVLFGNKVDSIAIAVDLNFHFPDMTSRSIGFYYSPNFLMR